MTDDGFGAHAIAVDETTGCHLWQGSMNGPEPRAGYRGAIVKPRLVAFERAYGPVPRGYRLDDCPHSDRCIRPEHQVTTLVAGTRSSRAMAVRRTLAGHLPAERPGHLTEREWAAIRAVVAGHSLAKAAASLGVSRQRVHQLVARARAKLGR